MSRGDLRSVRLIWWKGGLFLLISCLSGLLVVAELSSLKGLLLFMIAIWASCREYYFAFYVIEKYVDPDYRFSGLIDFFRYAVGRPRPPETGFQDQGGRTPPRESNEE